MKRLLTSLLCILMMLGLSMNCFAAKETLTNDKLSASHIVVAKYRCDYAAFEDYTVATDSDEDGVYQNTTEGGVDVTVDSDVKGKTLVVHEITDRDPAAAKWFQEQFAGLENIAPLEIFFADENGNRSELPVGTQITLDNLKPDQYVVALTTDGKKKTIVAEVVDGKIVFTAVDADYYVVCTPRDEVPENQPGGQPGEQPEEQPQEQPKPEQLPSVGPDTQPPKTGDQTAVIFLSLLMVVSAAGAIVIGKKLKGIKAE